MTVYWHCTTRERGRRIHRTSYRLPSMFEPMYLVMNCTKWAEANRARCDAGYDRCPRKTQHGR